MTPQESQLIQSVAQRLRATNLTEKDSQAERLIQTEIGSQKDGLYLLTQAVIVQEQGLKHAQERIQQLEAELQAARQQTAGATQHGGFLSGLFGGNSTPAPTPPASPPAPPPPASMPQTGGPSAAGSFLRTAAASAAGVIGGQLIFDGLRNMFGGGGLGSFVPGGGGFLRGAPSIVEENITNVYESNPLSPGSTQIPGDYSSGADFGLSDPNAAFGSGGDFGASSGNDPADASDNNADVSSGADYDDTNSYEEDDDDDMDDNDTY